MKRYRGLESKEDCRQIVVMSLQLASPTHRTFLIITIADNRYQLALSQTR